MKRIKIGIYFFNPKNLESKAKRRKESSGRFMGKRFYTLLDMAIVKKDLASKNGKIKRGEVHRKGNEQICVCGCGMEGCFLLTGNDSVPMDVMDRWEKDQSERRRKSKKWSEWK